jgi:hypothetical protein
VERLTGCDSSLGRTYIAVKKQTWLSQWLNDKLPYDFELSVDAGTTLAKWLPPFQSPADYWWSSEYYWGALIWFFFLSYESEKSCADPENWTPVANSCFQLVCAPSRGARPSCSLYSLDMSACRDRNASCMR